MKRKATAIILGILLIGIVSASLLTYFGQITGTVEVNGPILYLNGYDSGIYHDLLINEIPSFEEEVYLWDGQRLMFNTEELGVEDFYGANFDIKIWAKTNIEGNILQFQVVRIKPGLEEEIICVPPSVILTNTINYVEKETTCQSSGEINLNPEDAIGLIISGAGADSEYSISTGEEYTDGYSRVEVLAT